jgi:hypothetical protein
MSALFNRYTLLIGILLAIVVFSPGPGATRAGAALHDSAHAPVFACLTMLLLVVLARHRAQPLTLNDYLVGCVLGIVLGLATEVVQKLTGGDASWLDLRSDTVGALAACGLFAAFDRRMGSWSRGSLTAAAVAVLALHSVQFIRVGIAYAHRDADAPVLFDASTRRAELFVVATSASLAYTTLPAALANRPLEPSLAVRLERGDWPGVAFEEPYPDWSRYTQLQLDLANPAEQPLELNLRVLDRTHTWQREDRFNGSVRLAANARAVVSIPIADIERAPRQRYMDTRAIADLRLFADAAHAGRVFYVTRVWLE